MPTVYLSAVPERLLPGYLDPKGTMQISKIKDKCPVRDIKNRILQSSNLK